MIHRSWTAAGPAEGLAAVSPFLLSWAVFLILLQVQVVSCFPTVRYVTFVGDKPTRKPLTSPFFLRPASSLWNFYYDPNRGASPFPSEDNDQGQDRIVFSNRTSGDCNVNGSGLLEDPPRPEGPISSMSSLGSCERSISQSCPQPAFSALEIVTLCMDALQNEVLPQTSLGICFEFSTDRCRAAVGGTLDDFVKYASNPVFGSLVHCQDYRILSVGPVIPGSQHRGEMRTVLVEIDKAFTVRDVVDAYNEAQESQSSTTSGRRPSGRPTIEERMRAREEQRHHTRHEDSRSVESVDRNRSDGNGRATKESKRVFLWTLQKERRPPRQDCWLVHEVLDRRNAFLQTS